MFERKWGVPRCAGAIDGSPISIAPPEYHTNYLNRKSWLSIILQGNAGPCYTSGTSMWVGLGVFMMQEFLQTQTSTAEDKQAHYFPTGKRKIKDVEIPILLVGDPAYSLLPWVMKPFANTGHLSKEQVHFNYRVS